jgi:hypothetical protein
MKPLYLNNTNTVSLIGLQDSLTSSIINTDATVTAKVTYNGQLVPDSEINLVYYDASSGNYAGDLPILSLVKGNEYVIEITAEMGSTPATKVYGNWRIDAVAKERGNK